MYHAVAVVHVAIRWPDARPAMPKQQQGASPLRCLKLSYKKLKAEVIGTHMLLVPGVLSIAEAQKFIDTAEQQGFQHQSSRGPAFGEAFRDNHRISFHDPELADQLWTATGLRETLEGVTVDDKVPIGLNPNLRFYRYTKGQKFGKHIDDSVELAPGQYTGYTVLIYLSGRVSEQGDALVSKGRGLSSAAASGNSSGKGKQLSKRGANAAAAAANQAALAAPNTNAVQQLVGGETIFYGARNRVVASVSPVPGLALLHLHGEDRCLEHEAAEVQQGVKYVLRSDVVFAAP